MAHEPTPTLTLIFLMSFALLLLLCGQLLCGALPKQGLLVSLPVSRRNLSLPLDISQRYLLTRDSARNWVLEIEAGRFLVGHHTVDVALDGDVLSLVDCLPFIR